MVDHLMGSSDAWARRAAAKALAAWKDTTRFVELLVDPRWAVRRVAYDAVSAVGPDAGHAELAWAELAGCRHEPQEVLRAAIALSEPGSWHERTRNIAADVGQPEAVRVEAVVGLCDAGARRFVASLIPLLREPPELTWALHEMLAEAALELNIPLPDLAHLRDHDHLTPQRLATLA